MGTYLAKGTTFVDGVTQVNATNLNAHVDNAILQPTAISSLSLKDPLAGTESTIINDAGTLKRTTIQAMVDLSTIVPVGTVVSFAGGTAPAGWFLCQGQSLSRTTYSALFGVIGTTYGTTNSTLFSLPDCRGRVVAGVDAGAGRIGDPTVNVGLTGVLGAVGGLYYHTLTDGQMPQHNHGFNDYYVNPTGPHGGPIQFGNDFTPQGTTTPNGTDYRGGNQAHNNVQPTIIMQHIIKF